MALVAVRNEGTDVQRSDEQEPVDDDYEEIVGPPIENITLEMEKRLQKLERSQWWNNAIMVCLTAMTAYLIIERTRLLNSLGSRNTTMLELASLVEVHSASILKLRSSIDDQSKQIDKTFQITSGLLNSLESQNATALELSSWIELQSATILKLRSSIDDQSKQMEKTFQTQLAAQSKFWYKNVFQQPLIRFDFVQGRVVVELDYANCPKTTELVLEAVKKRVPAYHKRWSDGSHLFTVNNIPSIANEDKRKTRDKRSKWAVNLAGKSDIPGENFLWLSPVEHGFTHNDMFIGRVIEGEDILKGSAGKNFTLKGLGIYEVNYD